MPYSVTWEFYVTDTNYLHRQFGHHTGTILGGVRTSIISSLDAQNPPPIKLNVFLLEKGFHVI